MEELIVGAVLACAGGLAFLAYNHPVEMKKLSGPIMLGCLILWAVLCGWQFGTQWALTETIPYLQDDKFKDARNAVERIQFDTWAFFAAPFVVQIYMQILVSWVATLKDKNDIKDNKS